MSLREHLAEILIAATRAHDHRQHAAALHRELAACDGTQPELPGLVMCPCGTVNAIAIRQRQA